MKKLIEKIRRAFASAVVSARTVDDYLDSLRTNNQENAETVECINFTKPNEKSHLTVGSGTTPDGSVFISVSYIPDGVEEQVGTQREIRDEQKEPIIALRFYQGGSIDSFIEQLNWAKEHLNYKQEQAND